MKFHDEFGMICKENESSIEIFKKATINSIASFIYSEYLLRSKRQVKNEKVRYIVPSIDKVKDYLNPDSDFMEVMLNDVIDKLSIDGYRFTNFKDFSILRYPKWLGFIFVKYIEHECADKVSDLIIDKFKLNTANSFYPNISFADQDDSIKFINTFPSDNKMIDYFVQEILAQMVDLSSSIKKSRMIVESGNTIKFNNDDVDEYIVLNHPSAIVPIIFNTPILRLKKHIPNILLMTNTSINDKDVIITSNQNDIKHLKVIKWE